MLRLCVAVVLAILAAYPAQALDEPWMGHWAVSADGCKLFGTSRETAPLVVWEKSLSWVTEYCSVGKLYRIGQDAHIQAHCSSNAATVPISLKPKGDRMTVFWNNVQMPEMRRCK